VKLKVSFDAGSSIRKIVWKNPYGENKVKHLVMSPYEAEVVRLPRLGEQISLEQIWIGYGDRQFVLGQIASDEYASSTIVSDSDERKYERAVRMTLGVLGYLKKVESNIDWGTPIDIGLLLPYKEYRDGDNVERLLREHLEGFSWCGEEMRFNLENFTCRPEGFGVYSQCANHSLDRILTFVFGHRDATALFARKQRPDAASETVPLGLNNCIQYICQDTGVSNEMHLTRALIQAGYPLKTAALEPLIQAVDKDAAEYEMAKLTEAIETARDQYCLSVKNWLTKKLKSVDQVLICGGTAQYLRADIENWFGEGQFNWCDRLIKQMSKQLSIKDPYQQARLADPYGLFLQMGE
jgi:hypothetical protein